MRFSGAFFFVVAVAVSASGQMVFVEAEGFEELGGWVVDQQAMDQMGSPYLLAHGLGEPVKDAATDVLFPEPGAYRVWVRTRDWVASFGAPGAPGRFQVQVDGVPLEPVFGTEGAAWHWQDGGLIEIAGPRVRLSLHDLTGFEGRCDALLFTKDTAFVPPDDGEALLSFRRAALGLPERPQDAGQFDFVVVGGGIAGTCAAVSAARLGLSVALVQDRPVLGGNNSSEVRVHLQGKTNLPPYPALGNLVRELDSGMSGNARPAANYNDGKKLAVATAEPNLALFLNMHAYRTEMAGDSIAAVLAKDTHTGEEWRFPARWFADCTGDGSIGFLAGADYRMGRESRAETGEALAPEQPDAMTMGSSVMWYSKETDAPAPFPECPWAELFTEETAQKVTAGEWDWETGLNRNQVTEIEQIRDHALRVIYGNWAFLKNHSADKEAYANRQLDWVAYMAGKRESRRLLGDVVLQQQHIEFRREFEDACVTTTWSIDLHYPEPTNTQQFPGREFRTIAEHKTIVPYAIPYRCLYSRNIDNLFMAGRDISVTHVALGTIRVMRTGGMMGEVVGMAASLCRKHDTTPRGVYARHLRELQALMQAGIGQAPQEVALQPPPWRDDAGPNLALAASVTVSSTLDEAQYPPAHINDGVIDLEDAGSRWCSARKGLPHTVDFRWDTPQTINAARIVSGWRTGPHDIQGYVEAFALQVYDDGAWRDIPGTAIEGNAAHDWHARFDPVTTDRLRLEVRAAEGDLARLFEVELFNLPEE
ncbi:MAG TPA: FAD-dependent oxidoreductase [Candidatus Hydrogenedentes bacterium]|nr:FAD-dependent oxidoreductase [Candidatus Hydrogenedentota bacterium]